MKFNVGLAPRTSCLMAALALFAAAAPHATKPEKLFPEFKARKDSLGTIALLADVVVVERRDRHDREDLPR
jgi:hypothetical protein